MEDMKEICAMEEPRKSGKASVKLRAENRNV